MKQASERSAAKKNVRSTRQQCHRHFWKYARDILDDDQASKVVPKFTENNAEQFFRSCYESFPYQFEQPPWMPESPLPKYQLELSPKSTDELLYAIKRAKSVLCPYPFQVSYKILKKCPSLHEAILDSILAETKILMQWKTAVIKLIGNSSAIQDPSNFRPIALTPTMSKLFSTIMKD